MSDGTDNEPRRTATVTVLFCDLVGSTERQSRIGDDANDEFRRSFFAVLRAAVASSHGEVVKTIGDAVMAVFRDSALDAVTCAAAMHQGVAALDGDHPVQIRIGISAGEAAEEDGDWFGTPVVEAARLEALASPGQTLITDVVRVLVGTRGGFAFRIVGERTLKGLPGPVSVVELVPERSEITESVPAARERRRTPLVAVIAAAVVILIVAAAIGIAARGGGHTSTATASAADVSWHDNPVYKSKRCTADLARQIRGVTCGTLTVPENRSRPNGRQISLAVTRAPARGASHRDPVIDFGADDLATSPARAYADEIQLEGRGANLTCPEYSKIARDGLTLPSGDAGYKQRAAAAIKACYDSWTKRGFDLNAYNVIASGDDVVDLIRALHLDHVNLVSGYIASISALEVARQLPDAVRTMTLQEPVSPGASASSDPTAELAAAYESYVALCNANATCKGSFPDLAGAAKRVYDTYQASPRIVQADDGDGHKHAVLLDGARADQAMFAALNNRKVFPLFASGVAAKDRSGTVDQLTAGQVAAYNADIIDPKTPWGAFLSGECAYDAHTISSGRTLSSRTLPQFSGLDTDFLTWACKAWPVREAPQTAFDDPSSSVPTLILNPGFGPGIDASWIDDFRAGLPNATVATFPTIDAGVLSDNVPACIGSLRHAFMTDPTSRLNVGTCEQASPPVHFVASLGH